VTTLNQDGGINAAPFSPFIIIIIIIIIIAADPGLLGFSIGPGPAPRAKDTAGERAAQRRVRHQHGARGACGSRAGVRRQRGAGRERARPRRFHHRCVREGGATGWPRLIQLECRLERIVELGNAPNAPVVGRIVLMHARHGLIDYRREDAAACGAAAPYRASGSVR
jgi:flavin reductase (DIM6/NTAB) family NADH-FMN oxidoreductase RutF